MYLKNNVLAYTAPPWIAPSYCITLSTSWHLKFDLNSRDQLPWLDTSLHHVTVIICVAQRQIQLTHSPYPATVSFNDLYSFDPATTTWTLLSAVDSAPARCRHGFTSAGGKLYVHGGVYNTEIHGMWWLNYGRILWYLIQGWEWVRAWCAMCPTVIQSNYGFRRSMLIQYPLYHHFWLIETHTAGYFVVRTEYYWTWNRWT
jgi:hypothetical protein